MIIILFIITILFNNIILILINNIILTLFIIINNIILIMMMTRYHRCQFDLSLPTTSSRRSQGFPPAELQVQVGADADDNADNADAGGSDENHA